MPLRNKLEDTSEPGCFIGYPAGTKGYKILLDNGRVISSRDVTFTETGNKTANQTPRPAATTDNEEDGMDSEEEDAEPVGAGAGPSAAPPSGSNRPTPPHKRPRRTATNVPASVWRDEGYKISGRKRETADSAHTAIIHEPSTLEEALASDQAELWL